MGANAFGIGDRVTVVGRTLTFLGKKFYRQVGEVTGHTTKHELLLFRVKFENGEALYEEKDLRIYND